MDIVICIKKRHTYLQDCIDNIYLEIFRMKLTYIFVRKISFQVDTQTFHRLKKIYHKKMLIFQVNKE